MRRPRDAADTYSVIHGETIFFSCSRSHSCLCQVYRLSSPGHLSRPLHLNNPKLLHLVWPPLTEHSLQISPSQCPPHCRAARYHKSPTRQMAPTSQGRSPVATPSLMEHSLRCVHVTTYLSIDSAPYPLPHQLQPGRPNGWVIASVHIQCVVSGARHVFRKPVGLRHQHWPDSPSHTEDEPHILLPVGCTGVYSVRAAGSGWGALCWVGAPVP